MKRRVTCFGELLLRLSTPAKELFLQSPALQMHVGGAEANVAVSLSRLGHAASLVTALPDNLLAHACVDELRRHRVNVEGVHFDAGRRIGLYFLTHGAGHRPAEVLYDRSDSAFAHIEASAFDWPTILRDVDWLHISGITPAVSGLAANAARSAMLAAGKARVKISFDSNFRARLWAERASEAPQILRELCAHADLLFADERDIALMYGGEHTGEQAAAVAFSNLPKLQWLACTVRERSSTDMQPDTALAGILRSRSARHASKRYSLGHVVDRIGSGDAFAAGVIDQLLLSSDLHTADLQAAVEFGAAAAVLKHSIAGDFNLSLRSDIESLVTTSTTGGSVDVRR